MSRARPQARTRRVSTRDIVASKEFARGLDEVRNGLPFNPDNDSWNYERGRDRGHLSARQYRARGVAKCGRAVGTARPGSMWHQQPTSRPTAAPYHI